MSLRAIHAIFLTLIVSCVATRWLSSVHAADVARSGLAVEIDRAIDAVLTEHGITAAETVSDAEYLRRVTLDLAGRISTAKEMREFLDSSDANKREKLVDRLMTSPDFCFHQRNELDILLLAQLQWNTEWRTYLLEAMREHRTWDQLVRELLLPEKARPDDKGAAAFLKQRAKDLDAMTNDTSTLLFGVNIACAKCHDHPLVPDWKQDHYFGFASFFQRTFATRRGLLAERFDGELKFTTTEGEEKHSNFMFLNGKTVEEPPVSFSDEEWKQVREKLKKAEQDEKADPPPTPPFSPRERLVSLALQSGSSASATAEGSDVDPSSEQPLLARNLANRLWARLMGQGLVHPLDQMHTGNPPSHPQLLERLTSELLVHHYDPRPLIRGIMLSQAYARSSRWSQATERPAPEMFAVRAPRPLTPFQYSLSLWIASRNPESLPGTDKPEDWVKQREQWEQHSEGFARRFEIPTDQFQISVEEALLLSNNPQAESEFLADQGGTLVGHLQTIADANQKVDTAFFTILGRAPAPEEREAATNFLAARQDRSTMGLQQLVWGILTSAEFRFNH